MSSQGIPGSDLQYAELPLLYRDGIHDDTPAIRAVLNGNPVRCAWCLVLMRSLEHPPHDLYGRRSECPGPSSLPL